jgi:hypothetical protein
MTQPVEKDVAYDNCPPAASHTCDECKRVPPSAEIAAAVERVCMERTGCHDYRHGTDCPMYDWPRSLELGRPL